MERRRVWEDWYGEEEGVGVGRRVWEDWYGEEEGVGVGRRVWEEGVGGLVWKGGGCRCGRIGMEEEGVGVGRRCRCGRRWLESGEEVSMGGG